MSKLRFIKREEDDIKSLVKKIAVRSGAGAKQLETFAKHDKTIVLTDLRLPPGEEATRKAIASTKQKELLGQHGQEFEMSLFLTQAEALSYGAHLAKVAAQNDAVPERAQYLAGLSEELKGLQKQLVDLMLSRAKVMAPAR
ncbi:MAG: hypothetical protein JWQ71_1338 [Pedosphaera sp.]|nr:hypothetical protein [Pedosphaera sp.]